MLKLFDNTQIVQEARLSGRGGKLWKELLMTFLMVGVVFFLISIIEAVPIILLFGINAQDPIAGLLETNATVASLYMRIISSIIFVLFCRFCQKRSFTSFGFKPKGALIEYAKGLLIGFIMFSAVVLVGKLFNAYYFVGLENEVDYMMILTIFGGFIIQGAQEEILCRGYIMTSIARKNNVWLGIVINSIVFALLHMNNNGLSIIPILNLFLFGLFMSLYMLKTDSIIGVCAIHTIWNFVQGSFFGLNVSGVSEMPSVFRMIPIGSELLNGGDFGPEGSIVTSVVLLIAIGVIMTNLLLKKKGDNNESRIAESDQSFETNRKEDGQGAVESN